jgi:hypothetical protein
MIGLETVVGLAFVGGSALVGTAILAISTARMRRAWGRAARELGLRVERARRESREDAP